ncbi:MAG: (2Fe-2S) ferredoxin domain-containing protein [Nitriliruptoraceae bacterium]
MSEKLQKRTRKARLDTMERHVLVCTDDDCGGGKVAKELRRSIAAHGLRSTVSVAKVDCLQICTKGTIAVVYPEGTWYAGLKPDRVEQLVTTHLRDGEVVEDLLFHRNQLGHGCWRTDGHDTVRRAG